MKNGKRLLSAFLAALFLTQPGGTGAGRWLAKAQQKGG